MTTYLPEPKVGMVVNYEYLWARQYAKGDDCGEKVRPCAILAIKETKDDVFVYVSPITHTAPWDANAGVVLGTETLARIGLNADKRWLMCSEVNKFSWPGYNLRNAPKREHQARSCVWGSLPNAVLVEARAKLSEYNNKHELKFVPRDKSSSMAMAG